MDTGTQAAFWCEVRRLHILASVLGVVSTAEQAARRKVAVSVAMAIELAVVALCWAVFRRDVGRPFDDDVVN